MKITALPASTLAALLTKAAGEAGAVTTEQIEQDLAAGAPQNEEGTINLVHYTAWLAREDR